METSVGAGLALPMGQEVCRSGSFPGGCSSPTTHRAGLHGHGCKHYCCLGKHNQRSSRIRVAVNEPALVLLQGGDGVGGRGAHLATPRPAAACSKEGLQTRGEGREWVLGETGDREGHGASAPQTGCLSLPSPGKGNRGDRSWLCMGLTGAPSLAAPPACPHCCKAQHLSQPFPGCFSP